MSPPSLAGEGHSHLRAPVRLSIVVSCTRLAGFMSPPVSRRWFSPRDASLSSCGVPASPVPPLSAVLRRRYDLPSACPWSLIGSLPLPTSHLRVRVRRSAPGNSEGIFQARAFDHPVALIAGSDYVDANGISQVFRRSIPCLCSVPRPRSNRRALAIAVTPMLPPLCAQRRLRAMADFGADSRSFGTCCPTLRVLRCRSHARLASG